jgi:hypothetical protein
MVFADEIRDCVESSAGKGLPVLHRNRERRHRRVAVNADEIDDSSPSKLASAMPSDPQSGGDLSEVRIAHSGDARVSGELVAHLDFLGSLVLDLGFLVVG